MYCVSNTGFGPLIVMNKRRQPVHIPPKRELDNVDLDDKTAAYYKILELGGGKLRIKGLDTESKAVLEQAGTKKKPEPLKQEAPATRVVEETPIQRLLARMGTISIQQFRAEAKELLGADWPAGQVPNREGIVNLLKQHDEKDKSNDGN